MIIEMKIIDDGGTDQRRLYRTVTRIVHELIIGRSVSSSSSSSFQEPYIVKNIEEGGKSLIGTTAAKLFNTTSNDNDIGFVNNPKFFQQGEKNGDDIFDHLEKKYQNHFDEEHYHPNVSVESVQYEPGEREADPKYLLFKENRIKLTIVQRHEQQQQQEQQQQTTKAGRNRKDDDDVEENGANASSATAKLIGYDLNCPTWIYQKYWAMRDIEPFSRNKDRIGQIYRKSLILERISPSSLRVVAVMLMDLVSNTLLFMDVLQGAKNITTYRYVRQNVPSLESISTIIILSAAIIVTSLQLYTLLRSDLRTCPTLTVFAVPPTGIPYQQIQTLFSSDVPYNTTIVFTIFVYLTVLLSFAVGWGAPIVFVVFFIMVNAARDVGSVMSKQEHKFTDREELSGVVERLMWLIEIYTAFYLPFAHTNTTGFTTFVASIIDASAELWELSHSLVGAVRGNDFEVGSTIILRPGATEEEIMWSYMTGRQVYVMMDLNKVGDDIELQRFVTLINMYSLDGAGSWSMLARTPAEELGLKGEGEATIFADAVEGVDGAQFFSFGGREYDVANKKIRIATTEILSNNREYTGFIVE